MHSPKPVRNCRPINSSSLNSEFNQAVGLTQWLWISLSHGSNSHTPHGEHPQFLWLWISVGLKSTQQTQNGNNSSHRTSAFPTALVLSSSQGRFWGCQCSRIHFCSPPSLLSSNPGQDLMGALLAAPQNPIMQNEAVDNWAIPPWEASIL